MPPWLICSRQAPCWSAAVFSSRLLISTMVLLFRFMNRASLYLFTPHDRTVVIPHSVGWLVYHSKWTGQGPAQILST